MAVDLDVGQAAAVTEAFAPALEAVGMTSSLESWRGVSSSGGSDQRSRGTMRVERRGEEPRFVDIRESRRLEPLPNVEGRVTENAADAVESSIGNGPSERRLNWGCGNWVVPGWVNSDQKEASGVLSCDIRDGLPFADGTFEYAVSIHALPELALPELMPALQELRRVLRRDGVLRLGLPDFDKAVQAYVHRDREYFLVSDDEEQTLSGKLITQLLWYGYSRSLFTFEFSKDLMAQAGFRDIERCSYRATASPFPDIVALDNREHESFFIEGRA